jgi:hypothetical protein
MEEKEKMTNKSNKNKILFFFTLFLTFIFFLSFVNSAEGDYTGINWNISGQASSPGGITTNGTFFWISDMGNTDEVYIYYMNGTYTGNHWDTAGSGAGSPYSITQNGTFFWIADNADEEVYVYWFNGTYTNIHWDIGVVTNNDAEGITTDNNFIWISDWTAQEVFKYYMNGTYTGEHWDTSNNEGRRGITNNGTFFWNTDDFTYEVYKYYFNGTYTGSHWDTTYAGVSSPAGITQNGTFFWIVGMTDRQVYQFAFSDYTDNFSPWYRSVNHNNTIKSELTLFSINILDNLLMEPNGYYIFSTNNSGSWVNDSAVNFTTSPYWANVTKTLNSTAGVRVGYRWYIYDNVGNSNNTPVYELTTLSDEISPTYSNYNVNETLSEKLAKFSIYINDNVALHSNGQYIFSTNNSGSWVNNSAVNFTETPSWANITKILNETGNMTIGYMWYITDREGNKNNTLVYTLKTKNYTVQITDPTTLNPENVSSGGGIFSIAFNFLENLVSNVTSGLLIDKILINGVEAIIQGEDKNFYLRTSNTGSGSNPTALTFSTMYNTNYSVLFNSLTDTDVVYSSGSWASKDLSSFSMGLEDDAGGGEIANFMWGVINYGYLDLFNNNNSIIQCGNYLSPAGSGEILTFGTAMPFNNYSFTCSTQDDDDTARCSIDGNTLNKTTTGIGFQINDDAGNNEAVPSMDYCVFSQGEYVYNGVNIKAGNITQSAGVFNVTFTTPFSGTNYAVFMTHNEDDLGDACACETTTITAGSFTATCEDDDDATTTCDGDIIDWIAINVSSIDKEISRRANYASGTGWIVNFTAPIGFAGLVNLVVSAIYNTITKNETQSDAISYDLDSELPQLVINSPTNTTYSEYPLRFNVTATDNLAVDTCIYSLDDTANDSLTNSGNYWYVDFYSLSNGLHNVTFYCNDTSNNLNQSSQFFTIETPIVITTLRPYYYEWFTEILGIRYFNITTDLDANTCWMQLGQGVDLVNYTMQEINSTAWGYINSSMFDNSYSVEYFCNTSSGTESNSSTIPFYVETTKVETLQDNFDDNSINASLWDTYGNVTETNSEIWLTSDTSGDSYNGIFSVTNPYVFKNSSVFVKIIDIGNMSIDGYVVYLLYISSYKETIYEDEYSLTKKMFLWFVSDGNITAIHPDTEELLKTEVYNADTYRWVKLRESEGIVYWEYSSDGLNWNQFVNLTYDVGYGVIDIYDDMELFLRSFDLSSTTIFKADNFNILNEIPPDTTPPTFTTIPANATIQYGNESLGVYFVATDETGFDTFAVNDTRFAINDTGYLSNATGLEIGTYELNITINDTSNNINWTIYKVTIIQNTGGCGVYFNTTTPQIYPSEFIVYTNCSSAYTLLRNGTSISNASTQILGANYYNFTVQRTDTSNYTNTLDSQFFTIEKTIIQGTITGTTPIAYETTGDIQGSETNIGDGDLAYKLYRNGTEVSNPDASILASGAYSYIYNSTGGENYTSNSSIATFNLVINKNTGSCSVLFNETSPINYPNTFLVWTNCTSGFVLYKNGTIISNNSEQALEVGIYNFTVIRNDSFNYTNYYDEKTFEVSFVDTTAPTYLNNQTNSTEAGSLALFSLLVNDDTAIETNGYYIFSTNNSGSWVNDSAFNFTANPEWANATKTLNSTVGLKIGYKWYLYDNVGNFNQTPIYELITTDSGKPSATTNSPLNQSYSTSEILFNVTATDALSSISSCVFSLDGLENVSLVPSSYSGFLYSGNSWDTNAIGNTAPKGIVTNNTFIWTTDSGTDEVYKFYMNGTYTLDHFDTAGSGNGDPRGITQNGTLFWVTDMSDDLVYVYWMNGTWTGSTFATRNGDLTNGTDYAHGIDTDNTYIWITDWDTGADSIYKFFKNGTYIGKTEDPTSSTETDGITQNGVYFWTTANMVSKVNQFFINGTYTGINWSTYTENSDPMGITQNGTFFWIIDATDDEVYIYNMIINSNEYIYTNSSMTEGIHNVVFYCNDTSNNLNTTNTIYFTIDIADTTPPTFTTIPDNASISYGTNWSGVKFSATDETGFDTFVVNDTRFTINSTGFLDENLILGVGSYLLNITINDTSNNINWNLYQLNVTPNTEICQVLFNETSPLTYPQTFLVWANCTSEFTLYRNGTLILNNSEQALAVGTYNFSMQRTDTQNYSNNYNETLFTISPAPDTTNPIIEITYPVNNTNSTDYGLNVNFTYSDNVAIDSCWWSDDYGVTNNSNPTCLNLTGSWVEGLNNIWVYVNDTSGNEARDEITFRIDTTPPYFTSIANQTIMENETLSYTPTASDSGVGLSSWEINDTSMISINYATGEITNTSALIIGFYTYNITINDTLNNKNSTIWTLNITGLPDTTPPYFTTIPSNATLFYNNESLGVYFVATDLVGFDTFSVNDTRFIINSTGYLSNATILGAGVYELNITINDTSNNINWIIYKVTIIKFPQTAILNINETSPINYNTPINVTCNGDLFRNETNVTSEISQSVLLAGGTYLYSCKIYESENYSYDDSNQTFIINPIASLVYTYLNNTRANITFDNGTSIWLNGTLENGIGTIKLYSNNVLINEGTSNLSNYTAFPTAGLFNITTIFQANENYTSSYETFWVNVTGTLPPVSNAPNLTILTPLSETYNYTLSTTLSYNISNCTNVSSVWYSLNEGITNITINTTIDCKQNVTLSYAYGGNKTIDLWANNTENTINTSKVNFVLSECGTTAFQNCIISNAGISNANSYYVLNNTNLTESYTVFIHNSSNALFYFGNLTTPFKDIGAVDGAVNNSQNFTIANLSLAYLINNYKLDETVNVSAIGNYTFEPIKINETFDGSLVYTYEINNSINNTLSDFPVVVGISDALCRINQIEYVRNSSPTTITNPGFSCLNGLMTFSNLGAVDYGINILEVTLSGSGGATGGSSHSSSSGDIESNVTLDTNKTITNNQTNITEIPENEKEGTNKWKNIFNKIYEFLYKWLIEKLYWIYILFILLILLIIKVLSSKGDNKKVNRHKNWS